MSASENRPQEPQETGSIWAQSYRNIEWSHAATAPRYWPAISESVKYEHTVSMTIRFLLHRIGALLSIIFCRNDVAGDGSVEITRHRSPMMRFNSRVRRFNWSPFVETVLLLGYFRVFKASAPLTIRRPVCRRRNASNEPTIGPLCCVKLVPGVGRVNRPVTWLLTVDLYTQRVQLTSAFLLLSIIVTVASITTFFRLLRSLRLLVTTLNRVLVFT